eukprot:XP_011661249.1 PREDICTED: presqualene diphosphate phosphatase-like [Strongylocentrotus purpuratus]
MCYRGIHLRTVLRPVNERWGVCATKESTSGRLRPVMKGLEISGHGLPWSPSYCILYNLPSPRLARLQSRPANHKSSWSKEESGLPLHQSEMDLYFVTNSLKIVFFSLLLLICFYIIVIASLTGMLLDLLVSFILKGTVRRPRPALNKPDMLLTVSVDNYSFPSGHCTRAGFVFYFFVTTFTLPLLMQFLLLLWMSAVCISRVLLGRHYWSDVICGTIIGLLQGLFIQRNWKMFLCQKFLEMAPLFNLGHILGTVQILDAK